MIAHTGRLRLRETLIVGLCSTILACGDDSQSVRVADADASEDAAEDVIGDAASDTGDVAIDVERDRSEESPLDASQDAAVDTIGDAASDQGDLELDGSEDAAPDGSGDTATDHDVDADVPPTDCGDGDLNVGEECDLGADDNDGSYGGCNPDCTLGPFCGDGTTDSPQEGCDLEGANDDVLAACSTACQPTSLVLQLTASDVNGTGTPPDPDSAVGSWFDFAQGAHASQAEADMQPVYRQNALDGLPALEFDGNDDRLVVPINIDPSEHPDLTVAVVFQNAAGDTSVHAGLWGHDDGGWDRFMSTGGTFPSSGISNGSAYAQVPGLEDEETPIIVIATLRDGAGADASTVHVNGALALTFTESHPTAGDTMMSIGNMNGPSVSLDGFSFDGYLAEVYVYATALSGDDRTLLEAALIDHYTPGCGDYEEWNGSECVDIDECATDNGGCGDPFLFECLNQDEAEPVCVEAALYDYETLTAGVAELDMTDQFYSPLVVHGEGAFPIAALSSGCVLVSAARVRNPGGLDGRVFWGSREELVNGLWNRDDDSDVLLLNAINWASHEAGDPVVGVQAGLDSLTTLLDDNAVTWMVATPENLPDVDVFIGTSYPEWTDEEIAQFHEFLGRGGGLLQGGHGWTWGGGDVALEHPGNRRVMPAGITLTTNFCQVSGVVPIGDSPPFAGYHALGCVGVARADA